MILIDIAFLLVRLGSSQTFSSPLHAPTTVTGCSGARESPEVAPPQTLVAWFRAFQHGDRSAAAIAAAHAFDG